MNHENDYYFMMFFMNHKEQLANWKQSMVWYEWYDPYTRLHSLKKKLFLFFQLWMEKKVRKLFISSLVEPVTARERNIADRRREQGKNLLVADHKRFLLYSSSSAALFHLELVTTAWFLSFFSFFLCQAKLLVVATPAENEQIHVCL